MGCGITTARGRGTAFNDGPLDFFDRVQLLLGFGESAAQACIFLDLRLHPLVRVCLRPAAVVECRQQPTILGFELQTRVRLVQQHRGERALFLRHALRRCEQRFQQPLAFRGTGRRMSGSYQRDRVSQRARRRRRARVLALDFVEDVRLSRRVGLAQSVHRVEVDARCRSPRSCGAVCGDRLGAGCVAQRSREPATGERTQPQQQAAPHARRRDRALMSRDCGMALRRLRFEAAAPAAGECGSVRPGNMPSTISIEPPCACTNSETTDRPMPVPFR